MQLYKVIFACTFGKGSVRPLRAALFRIGTLWVLGTIIGLGLAYSMPPLPVHTINLMPLAASTIFVVQLTVLGTLLASYGVTRPGQQDNLGKLLQFLPIKQRRHWAALLLPSLVLTLLALSLLVPLLYALAHPLGLTVVALTFCLVIGLVSAYGLVYGLPKRLAHVQIVMTPLALWCEYHLLQAINTPGGGRPVPFGSLLAVLILLEIILFVRSSHMTVESSIAKRRSNIRVFFLVSRLWFAKKVMRAHITHIDMVITFCMSTVVASVSQQLHLVDVSLLIGLTSVMIAAFVADIRAISRQRSPAEIVVVRGTFRFMIAQLLAALWCGLLIVSPLITLIFWNRGGLVAGLLSGFCSQIFLGIASGIFAGTLVAPEGRDITAQSGATMLAIAMLLVPQLPLVADWSASSVLILKTALIAGLLLGACAIEYKRNAYNWRKLHVAPN